MRKGELTRAELLLLVRTGEKCMSQLLAEIDRLEILLAKKRKSRRRTR